MNATNTSIITMLIVLIIFISLGIKTYENIKEFEISNKYKTKVEYALSSSLVNMFDDLNSDDISQMAVGNVNKFNEQVMFDKFIEMLDKNFSMEETNLSMIKYLDKYIILYNDGLVYNYRNINNERTWSEKIPYSIKYNDDIFTFNLDSDDYYIDNNNLKQLAIVSTLRRNTVIENTESIAINFPYKNNNYNTIKNKTVIVSFTCVPIINNKKVNIAVIGGNEIKNKNIYFINSNNKYEKINPKNITDDMITFENIKEAGISYYPEI